LIKADKAGFSFWENQEHSPRRNEASKEALSFLSECLKKPWDFRGQVSRQKRWASPAKLLCAEAAGYP
jgi:hypothetical protein